MPPSVGYMPGRRYLRGYNTNVFWHADSWPPPEEDHDYNIWSVSRSLANRGYLGLDINAYGEVGKISDKALKMYRLSTGFHILNTPEGSDDRRVNLMLANVVEMALFPVPRHSPDQTVILMKLTQYSEMICRVLASLKRRGHGVALALPEVDVEKAKASFGITLCSEQNDSNERIPVWLCPNLFDRKPDARLPQGQRHPEDEEERQSEPRWFIEPPTPDAHTTSFAMPADVGTCVFWDVEEYPLPHGLDLRSFCENILSAVRSRVASSTGAVSIYAYVVKVEEDFKADEAEDAQIKIRIAPADESERFAQMSMDFHFWSVDNTAADDHSHRTRPNLLLISKLLEADRRLCLGVQGCLRCIIRRGCIAFLAVPGENIPSSSSSSDGLPLLLPWEELSAKGKRKTHD
ncbi:unnamed protein product [Microthlaspi erraticum]|uniref:NYN domain-containing protein n=1 Tax=Microthlaspi erraticum TaxID=1685480 RepID=A0A6D2IDP4_9BRAS|nr:unnamed protein product [Microthlaspi erraticum]CAA7061353.1 unnamed protein product [Microthlaspi erraticum]